MSQPLLVDEPLQRINPADALVISIGIVIQSQDQLGIMVMDALQGAQFTLQRLLIANSGGNLYVVRPLLIDGDEVYIDFYNFERISLKNGLTPIEIRAKAA